MVSNRRISSSTGNAAGQHQHIRALQERRGYVPSLLVLLVLTTYSFDGVVEPSLTLRSFQTVHSGQLFRDPTEAPGDGEYVNIEIKATLNNGDIKEYKLNNEQDLQHLQLDVRKINYAEVNIKRHLNKSITLKAWRQKLLITQGFILKYFSPTGQPIMEHAGDGDVASAYCQFQGSVKGTASSTVILNLCDGVKGVIQTPKVDHTIQPKNGEFTSGHILQYHKSKKHLGETIKTKSCGMVTGAKAKAITLRKRTRVQRRTRLPAGTTSSSRYVEVYVVMDHGMYQRYGSINATVARAVEFFAYANSLYRQLDIYLAIVGVEIWNEGNKISYGNSSDARVVLRAFTKYRQNNINYNTANDAAELFTSVEFSYRVIGLASQSSICSQLISAGVNSDSNMYLVETATVMAHELAHNIGLHHSDLLMRSDCGCVDPDDPSNHQCIMHSTYGPKDPRVWSQCSKDEIRRLFDLNADHCLKNEPAWLTELEQHSASCGNLFVEQEEECDCGPPENCESQCCNPATCKLYANATCATGSCCDLDTCLFHPASHPCRVVVDQECDLQEVCRGDSEWCPDNTYKLDGTECNNRGPGYCYNGQCNTHNSQCYFIWRLESAQKSDESCYERYNNESEYYGNCGWSTVKVNTASITITANYKKCLTNQDKQCGLLHCQFNQVGVVMVKIVNLATKEDFQTHQGHLCAIAAFDVGFEAYDPGQVPNEAKCAENRMCVNSRCVDVPTLPSHCHCNGRGVCNQLNECQCSNGYSPPDCAQKISDVSTSKQPPGVTSSQPTITVNCGTVVDDRLTTEGDHNYSINNQTITELSKFNANRTNSKGRINLNQKTGLIAGLLGALPISMIVGRVAFGYFQKRRRNVRGNLKAVKQSQLTSINKEKEMNDAVQKKDALKKSSKSVRSDPTSENVQKNINNVSKQEKSTKSLTSQRARVTESMTSQKDTIKAQKTSKSRSKPKIVAPKASVL